MKAEYISHMGTDLTVVNAARVSFDKTSSYEEARDGTWYLKESDQRLIRYLAKHNHWTPFAHPQVTIHIKAPLFVARQLGKHQVGMVWNEVSRRYVDSEPEFYHPDVWRRKAANVKQGSSEEAVDIEEIDGMAGIHFPEEIVEYAAQTYEALLTLGVCAEQARMVLPQSMYTEWYWTGSLHAFARVCKLRLDSHTQKETRVIAQQINDIIKPLFPVSWKALMENNND